MCIQVLLYAAIEYAFLSCGATIYAPRRENANKRERRERRNASGEGGVGGVGVVRRWVRITKQTATEMFIYLFFIFLPHAS